MKNLAVVVLAAGKGTRMKTALPKALVPLCGKPMLWFVLNNLRKIKKSEIVVVGGYGYDEVKKFATDPTVKGNHILMARQKEQLGSGHALLSAKDALKNFKGQVLVVYCDTPMVSTETLQSLVDHHYNSKATATLLSVELDNPTGYGRIVRGPGGLVERIVEENDATPEQKRVKEINIGCYIFEAPAIFNVLKGLPRNEKKKEYYLTDAIAALSAQGRVEAVITDNPEEMQGANSYADVVALQEIAQKRIFQGLFERGVVVRDPKTTTVDAGVEIGNNTVLFPHTVIEEDSVIGQGCKIGPFARIRGNSKVGDQAVVGNFVEIVRSEIGTRSQVKHLSYLGDAKVGVDVNVGAGTITANFDGKNKHETRIKDGAQLGSGTVLIAPVTVGKKAKTGAGAVVCKGVNVPDGAVVVGMPAKTIFRKK